MGRLFIDETLLNAEDPRTRRASPSMTWSKAIVQLTVSDKTRFFSCASLGAGAKVSAPISGAGIFGVRAAGKARGPGQRRKKWLVIEARAERCARADLAPD